MCIRAFTANLSKRAYLSISHLVLPRVALSWKVNANETVAGDVHIADTSELAILFVYHREILNLVGKVARRFFVIASFSSDFNYALICLKSFVS